MEYPKMLYRSETEHRVVQDASEEEKARGDGFGDYAGLNKPAPQSPQEAVPAADAPKKRR